MLRWLTLARIWWRLAIMSIHARRQHEPCCANVLQIAVHPCNMTKRSPGCTESTYRLGINERALVWILAVWGVLLP
jgi:hypothetical protein